MSPPGPECAGPDTLRTYADLGRCDLGSGTCAYRITDVPCPSCVQGACAECVTDDDCPSADLCRPRVCQSGTCVDGAPVVCGTPPDDCHEPPGICDPSTGLCDYPPKDDGSGCEDGDACTVLDVCMSGECRPGTTLDCDDGDPCTDDVCDPATGCRNPNNAAACDDQDLCTHDDTCANGVCAGTVLDCSEPFDCRTRYCDGSATCAEDLLPAGSECTDDGNPCTEDLCDANGNCTHVNLPNGTQCGASSSRRCCAGSCVDISQSENHCGGCNSACAPGLTCESVSVTNTCSLSPANVTGRCRCQAANAQCPRGQVCRTVQPWVDRCAPANAGDCAPNQTFVDLASCPNYCRY